VSRVLEAMPGAPIDIAERPPGCPFAPRCPQKVEACETYLPVLDLKGPDHYVRCPEWTRTALVDWAAQAAAAEAEAANLSRPVLLEVVNLRAEHRARSGTVVAVDGSLSQSTRASALPWSASRVAGRPPLPGWWQAFIPRGAGRSS